MVTIMLPTFGIAAELFSAAAILKIKLSSRGKLLLGVPVDRRNQEHQMD